MKKDFIYWLRWIFILPGALVTSILSTFLLHLILVQTLRHFIEPYPEFPERILTPFVITLTFIWGGCEIAPSNKIKVGFILAILWLIISIFLIYLTKTNKPFFGLDLYLQANGIASILGIIGALVGLIIVKRQIKVKN